MGLARHLLDSASSHLGAFVASGLLHGTILAAITLLLCATVLRRARPALVAALWTIVLIKFALPVGPQVPVSVDGLTQSLFGADAAGEPPALGAVGGVAEPDRAQPAAAAATDGDTAVELAARLGLLALYLACVGVLLARRVRRQRIAYGTARRLPLPSAALAQRAARSAQAVGLRRPPELRLDPGNRIPHVIGLLRPVVVIPEWLASRPAEFDAVLAHELAHLRRRDPWARCAQVFVSSVFFFWPVVAWVNRRIDCAREMACDQWAVSQGRLGAVGYARLLFDMARRAPQAGQGAAPAVALLNRRRQLERRIDGLVAARPRPGAGQPRLGLVTGVAVAAWALVSLGGAARANAAAPADYYPECVIDPTLVQHILADYPEADTDGDGELTRAEICAHQARMKRRVLDDAFDEMDPALARDVASWLDPAVDRDRDGVLSESELDQLKTSVATTMKPEDLGLDPVEFPGQVCEEAPVSCTESIEPAVP